MIARWMVTDSYHDVGMGRSELTGLVTVRVWLHGEVLVARITLAGGTEDPPREYVVASVQEVQDLLVGWLRTFEQA